MPARNSWRWLSRRRHEAAEGNLDPAYSDGLAHVHAWKTAERPRTKPAGTTASRNSWLSMRKATIAPTTTITRTMNTPSECGSTGSGTNAAKATSTP